MFIKPQLHARCVLVQEYDGGKAAGCLQALASAKRRQVRDVFLSLRREAGGKGSWGSGRVGICKAEKREARRCQRDPAASFGLPELSTSVSMRSLGQAFRRGAAPGPVGRQLVRGGQWAGGRETRLRVELG